MRTPSIFSLFSLCVLSHVSCATVLRNFQVAQPVPVPQNVKTCTVKVLERDFAFSFGLAEVVHLEPPTECGLPGSWSKVTLNLTATSNGTQYDRLAHFTFQNVEIWRTSTPEPTRGDGIIWTYIKDVTRYIPLFSKPGTFIFQLDNLVRPDLDGIYSTVVHATYYASNNKHPPAPSADLLVPISNFRNDTGNHVSVPPAFAINVTLPRNTAKVFAELYASGNGEEEFWYFNTVNKYLPSLPEGFLGQGPFREVRLLVDGQVAGAAYPYISIYTGGFVPSAWRPIPSYGALDLPTYYIDLTPFVPILSDGSSHTITVDVTSAEEDHTTLQNWYLSGVLQVFLDKSEKPTTGKITKYLVEPFSQSTTTGSVGGGDVNVTVVASRKVHIESTVISGSGKVNHVVWQQNLQYTNDQYLLNNTMTQNLVQTSKGRILSTHNGIPLLVDDFSYPIAVNYSNLDETGRSWQTWFDHSYIRDLAPLPIVTRSKINNRQLAGGFYFLQTGGNRGNGTNTNDFKYFDWEGNTYARRVEAVLNNITYDEISGTLANRTPASRTMQATVIDQSDEILGSAVRSPRFHP